VSRSRSPRANTTTGEPMTSEQLTDVIYEAQDGLCWITIDRPERGN